MYNRILNRPMFKLVGKTNDAQGTGITSGLDTPRNNYFGGGTIGGGMIHGNPMGNRTGFDNPTLSEQFSEIDVSVSPETRKRAFWTGIGEGFSNARTLGEGLSGAVEGQEKILGPAEATAATRGFELQKLGVEKEFDKESALIVQGMDDKTKIEVAKIANNPENTATGIKLRTLKDQLAAGHISQQEYNRKTNIVLTGTNLQKDANNLAAALIASGVDENAAAATALQIILVIQKSLTASGLRRGGRAGYQLGATNQGVQPMGNAQVQPASFTENIQETVQTPGETVTEDVQVRDQLKPSVDMDYATFRAKMPPEVTDDVVQLLYWNEDAFADFAQIANQDDVYAFNNKYQVSLVLPMNTEIA